MDRKTGKELIIDVLREKSLKKQRIYEQSLEHFKTLKNVLKDMETELRESIGEMSKEIMIDFSDRGDFDAQLRVAGDILVFTLHSNVFNFNDGHFIHKLDYVKEDPSRSYCSLIQVHNFLADSFKYNRLNDVGYLVARMFVNGEKHFFVEGKRQLGFLYNDFSNATIDPNVMRSIVESAILYTIDFDLLVPPYDAVNQITVNQKIQQSGNSAFKTGKRLGFTFEADSDNI